VEQRIARSSPVPWRTGRKGERRTAPPAALRRGGVSIIWPKQRSIPGLMFGAVFRKQTGPGVQGFEGTNPETTFSETKPKFAFDYNREKAPGCFAGGALRQPQFIAWG